MKWAARLVSALWSQLSRLWSRPYRTVVASESLPTKFDRKTLYIVEEDGFQEQAAMICPCGCGAVLHMNLLTDERPCWRVTRHADGTATLYPSVWRKKACRSHFWFRRGRIDWCRPEEAPHRGGG